MNKLILLGRLGADATLAYSADGKARLTFTIATDYGAKGNKETEWTSCVLWGDHAETMAQWLTKGKQVLLEGRLKTRSWESDGTKHYKTDCIVGHIELLGGRDKEDDGWKPKKEQDDDDSLPFD